MIVFNPEAPDGFSLENALVLAKACQLAYAFVADEDALASQIAELGLGTHVSSFFTENLEEDILGFVSMSKEFVLVVLRGTKPTSIRNLLTDGEIDQVSVEGLPGLVHSGFAESLASVWNNFFPTIQQMGANQSLWLAGHSLGGAIATLASVRLKAEGLPLRATYTYGMPRVGDPDFAQAFADLPPLYRFVNNKDIVPRLPPEESQLVVLPEIPTIPFFPPRELFPHLKTLHYRHVGALIHLSSDGTVLNETTSDLELAEQGDNLARLLPLLLEGIEDHLSYVEAIQSVIDAPGG